MAGQLRVLRQKIRSVQSTKKITKAMELIAASRIAKVQQRVTASRPYAAEITQVLSALASNTNVPHPLLQEREQPQRAAVLLVTSDRGFAGGYNANVIKRGEELQSLLRSEGKEPLLYVIGRRGISHYRFRDHPLAGEWSGFSEQPHYVNAREVADTLIGAFLAGSDDTADGAGPDGVLGVDELHIVYTEFVNLVLQRPVARRVTPMLVEETDEPAPDGPLPEYEFEPDAANLLDALLPKYVTARLYAALLEAAASESAARQRAMKSASDNADELAKTYSRKANQVRQAEITQEISEIVGGADALANAG
jgi:F-type H+-transporting ATPase subunit gamma